MRIIANFVRVKFKSSRLLCLPQHFDTIESTNIDDTDLFVAFSDVGAWAQYTETTTGRRLRFQSCQGNHLVVVRSTASSGSGLCDNMECMASNYNNTGGCKTVEISTERSTVYYFGSFLIAGSQSYELNVVNTAPSTPVSSNPDTSSNTTAIIVGAAMGGILVLGMIAIVVGMLLRRRVGMRSSRSLQMELS